MVDRFWDFQRDEWEPSATALRFEAGSPNSIGQAALHASTELFFETGMKRVRDRVLANSRYLIKNLQQLPGIHVASRTEERRLSGIVSFAHGARGPEEIYRALQKRGVSCAVRGRTVRVSPHFYQGESELDRFFEILEDVL
jgi:selenocysteine lyase/cysteine desulfurase